MDRPDIATIRRARNAYNRAHFHPRRITAELPALAGESSDFIRGALAALLWASSGEPDPRFDFVRKET